MTSLYICYEPNNTASLDALFTKLIKEHYHLLKPAHDGGVGAAWRKAMKKGVRDSDQVLLVFSEDAFHSPEFIETVAYAHKIERQMVCYDPERTITHKRLQGLGLRLAELPRIDPGKT